ncbi:hypothetical protein [Apilactobacillus xinyiensis]|uniref:hypothetical protein n=1 Tax=Apilactobacillus xinyiensis TaxID=2841032 RepID=UPI003364E224
MSKNNEIDSKTSENIKVSNLMLTQFFRERLEKETNSLSGDVTNKTIRIGELVTKLSQIKS